MRPFSAFVLSHVLASYAMISVVVLSDEGLLRAAKATPGEALLSWALSPLVAPVMLLWSGPSHPGHFAVVYASYLPVFFLTLYLARRRRRPSNSAATRTCVNCGYDLRATPDRCPECGTVPPPSA